MGNTVFVVDIDLLSLQMVEQHPRQRAKVHIRTGIDFGGRDRFGKAAVLHHQRKPFLEFARIVGKFHAVKQGMAGQGFKPSL
ncbi:hypothetical protein D1872_252390 [compost metagenome]